MNDLSFRGKLLGKKNKEAYINIIKLETGWKACLKFEDEMKRKTVFFQKGNLTAFAYLSHIGGTRCKTMNGLARKILLKCNTNWLLAYSEYLCRVANLRADAFSRGRHAKEWRPTNCHRLFKQ